MAPDRRVSVRLQVSKLRLNTLVDTGACRSLLHVDAWKDLCRQAHRSMHLVPGTNLRTLNGGVIESLGRTVVRILGKDLEVFVVKSMKHDLLLGDDALEALGAVIDFRNNTVSFMGKSYGTRQAGNMDVDVNSVQLDVDEWTRRYPDVLGGAKGPLSVTSDEQTKCSMEVTGPCFKQNPYRQPLKKRQQVDQCISEMLRDGIIEPSDSPYASPICLVKKPDNSVRFCVDYRKLNSITTKDAHPLPLIQDIFDNLAGAKVFSTLDLKSGYWQIPMAEDSKKYTAFATHRGLYQFKRMPFGLCNAPAIFQRFMNKVLAPFIGKFVMVYLDDIVVYSKDAQEHEDHLTQIFETFRKYNLKVKPSKCQFFQTEIKLLGYVVSAQGISQDPSKISAIKEMAPPRTVRQVRRFLGMTGYYRQCIPNYAAIARPLTLLTRKHVRFSWGTEEQEAWRQLRDLLTSDRVMAHPQVDKPYKLYCDASDYCVGGILVQEDDQGIERPVVYISKQLSGSQLTWPAIQKEAFAVIFSLKKLRPYLYGAEYTVFTDHKPLRCLFQQEVKNTRVQRWAVLLAEMGAKIEYRKGKNNVRADMLSRLHHETTDTNDSAEDSEGCQWVSYVEGDMETVPWEFDGLDKHTIKKLQQEMPEYQLGDADEEEYTLMDDGLLYSLKTPPGQAEYPRLVLPPEARPQVITRAHTEVGHQSVRKTMDRLSESYRWPGMQRDVIDAIQRCARCAVNRTNIEHPPPTQMPIAQYPGQIVGMDLSGPYAMSPYGNRYCLSIIDHCTGWTEVKPLKSKEAQHILRYLEQEYLPRMGPPEIVITDQGLEFQNFLIRNYLHGIGTEMRRSTAFHPETNGKIERFHRTLKGILRKLANARAAEWEDSLGPALWAHRVSISSVTGYSPFFLNYGRQPRLPRQQHTPRPGVPEQTLVAERLEELSKAFEEAARRTDASRAYNTERLQKRANATDLALGDHVMVLVPNRSSMDPKWDHGYIVTCIRGPVITVVDGKGQGRRRVNRRMVRKVDPDANWQELRDRQTRAQRMRAQERSVAPPPPPEDPRREHRTRDPDPEYRPPAGTQVQQTQRLVTRAQKRTVDRDATWVVPRKKRRVFKEYNLRSRGDNGRVISALEEYDSESRDHRQLALFQRELRRQHVQFVAHFHRNQIASCIT